MHRAVRADARTVLLAEQRLDGALGAATTVVHELRRGTVAFSGEPHETLLPRRAR